MDAERCATPIPPLAPRVGGRTWPAPASSAADEPGDLLVVDWPGYEDPSLFGPYDAQGADVRVEVSTDTDDTIAALRAGLRADLARPEVGYVEHLHDLGLIRPFDPSLLPNLRDVPPSLVARGRLDGEQYHVPVDWGFVAPIYRHDVVEPRRASYDLLFDERYAGRIAWFDTPWMLVIAGYVLGAANPWDMGDAELGTAADLLAERITLIHGFWRRSDDLDRALASGDVVVAYAWNVSFAAAVAAGVPASFLTRLDEGAIVWTEGFVLGADTPNFFAAHRYVDAWLSTETGRRLTARTGMGHATFEVDASVDPGLRRTLGLDRPETALGADVHVDRNIPRRRVYEEIWAGVRVAAPDDGFRRRDRSRRRDP